MTVPRDCCQDRIRLGPGLKPGISDSQYSGVNTSDSVAGRSQSWVRGYETLPADDEDQEAS